MATYSTVPELIHRSAHFPHPSEEEILSQLDRVVSSAHFRNSKRYPALLRFIVEETLAGKAESLKERTLGIEVFGRPIDYDTGLDPVVRVSAGEIRKRIAQYYQAPEHEHELRFDLPLGSYVPRFYCSVEDVKPEVTLSEPPEATIHAFQGQALRSSQRLFASPSLVSDSETEMSLSNASAPWLQFRSTKFIFVLLLLLTTIVATLLIETILIHRKQESGMSFFWNPLFSSKEDALIVLGVHALDDHGRDLSPLSSAHSSSYQSILSSMTSSEMVAISDVLSYSSIIRLLTVHTKTFRTQSSAETTIEDLRRGPVVLIGGFNNAWMMRISPRLRFRLIAESESLQGIEDSQHPNVKWDLDNAQSALTNSRDYAIVGCIFDPQIEQYVLFVAGIGKNGTEVGAEFITNNTYLQTWLANIHVERHENVEVVLSTDIIEGKHGPPHVIASAIW